MMFLTTRAAALAAAQTPISLTLGRVSEVSWPAVQARVLGGVAAVGDIIYAQPLHHRPPRLDLYRPAAKRPHPLVLYVHGGAWVTGTKRHGRPIRDFPAVLAQLAGRGFVVAAVEYRLDGEAKFSAAIRDVKAAIRFLRSRAAQYGLDPGRVAIFFGGSEDGQLAALAPTSCGVEPLSPRLGDDAEPQSSDCVQAAVSWYGVHDFRTVPTPPGQTDRRPTSVARRAAARPRRCASRARQPMETAPTRTSR